MRFPGRIINNSCVFRMDYNEEEFKDTEDVDIDDETLVPDEVDDDLVTDDVEE